MGLGDRLRWATAFCRRQSIFLSYSSSDRDCAEEIAQILVLGGHKVFFDTRSLKTSDDYTELIRRNIFRADRFVFLVSRRSLAEGSYTLTELQFAQMRWPSPVGRVLPVAIDPGVEIQGVPVYLRSVHILRPRGNVAAEVAQAIEGLARAKPLCWLIATAACAIVLAAGVFAWRPRDDAPVAEIALEPFEKIHFRPLAAPPANTALPDAPTDWIRSPVTVTLMPVVYNYRTDPGRPARLLSETLTLKVGDKTIPYRWAYVVEMTTRACPDWLCVKANVGGETLQPGHATAPRETMFLPVASEPLTWEALFHEVLSAPKPVVELTVSYTLDIPDGKGSREITRRRDCRIDVARARAAFKERGFADGTSVLPPFMQSSCLPSPP